MLSVLCVSFPQINCRMEIFEYLVGVSILTLLVGWIIGAIVLVPTTIFLAFHQKGKYLIFGKTISTIITSAVIVYFTFPFIEEKNLLFSLLYFAMGYYSYMVLFTLADETHRETIQSRQKNYFDKILLNASAYDKYMIAVSLVFFILAIIFPILTHFYIPHVAQKFYFWLLSYKLAYWIIHIFGTFAILYVLRFTIISIFMSIRSKKTNQLNYSLGFTNISDKEQLKQISAVTTIFSNLYIHDFSHSFDSLNFEYTDSRFRCMVFCLSTVVKDCEELINSQESLQNECLHFLSTFTTSKENIKEFFTQTINAEQAEREGAIYLDEYLKKWETYYNI